MKKCDREVNETRLDPLLEAQPPIQANRQSARLPFDRLEMGVKSRRWPQRHAGALVVLWRERQAGNGNATNELGLATRSQSVAILPTHTARQIAGIEPWASGWAQVPGNEAFQGLTDEWTASVAARL